MPKGKILMGKKTPKPSTARNAERTTPARTRGRGMLSNAENSRRNESIDKALNILDRQERRLGSTRGTLIQVRNPERTPEGYYKIGGTSTVDGIYSGVSRKKITRMTERQIRSEAGANKGSGTRKTGAKKKGF